MLHVLLLVLKILGILFLAVLGIVLAVLLVVLFVPVRYRLDGGKDGAGLAAVMAEAKVTWFLGLISARAEYKGKLCVRARVLWKTLFEETFFDKTAGAEAGIEAEPGTEAEAGAETETGAEAEIGTGAETGEGAEAGEEAKASAGAEAGAETEAAARAGAEAEKTAEEMTGAVPAGRPAGEFVGAVEPPSAAPGAEGMPEAKRAKPGDSRERAEAKTGSDGRIPEPDSAAAEPGGETGMPDPAGEASEPDGAEPDAGAEAPKPGLFGKLRGLKEKLCGLASRGRVTCRKGKNAWNTAQLFWADEENRKTLALLWRQVKKIFRHILPQRISGRVRFGFDDPYQTGQVLTAISPFYALYAQTVLVEPVFGEKVLEGALHVKGRVRAGTLAWIGVRVLFNRNFRKLLKAWRRHSRGGSGKSSGTEQV